MDELKTALDEHMDLVSHLFENLSSQLRSGMRPALDNFIGFFHAIDWKVSTYFIYIVFEYRMWRWNIRNLRFVELKIN